MSVQFKVQHFQSLDGEILRYGAIFPEVPPPHQTPIVFIPGLGGSIKNALAFLSQFAVRCGPIYSLDARGFGLNEELRPQPFPSHYLKDFSSFVNHLQAQDILKETQKPILFGLSLGGVLATLYSTQYKHPFKGKVLVAPAYRPHPKLFTLAFKWNTYLQLLTKGLHAMTTMPYGIQEITRNPEYHQDPRFEKPLSLPTLYLFFTDRLCKQAYRQSNRIDIPTAVVIPEQDLICDPNAMREAYNAIHHPHKKLFAYPNLYHDILMEPAEDIEPIYSDLTTWIASWTRAPQPQKLSTYTTLPSPTV